MAIIYVDSNAAGTNTGATKANARTTLLGGFTTWVPGDKIHISHLSNEVIVGAFSPSIINCDRENVCEVFRVNFADDEYAPTNGVDTIQIDMTSTTFDFLVNTLDFVVYHGLNISVGDNIDLDVGDNGVVFEDCYLEFTSDEARLLIGRASATADGSRHQFKNTTINFSHANGGSVYTTGGLRTLFEGCIFLGNSRANGLFRVSTAVEMDFVIKGCDFSQMTSMPFIFDIVLAANKNSVHIDLISCLLSPGQAIANQSLPGPTSYIHIHNTDSAGNTYITERTDYTSSSLINLSTYYNGVNPYIDILGSTQLSHQISTTPNMSAGFPGEGIELFGVFTTTGVKTINIQCLEDFTAALNKFDAWMEVFYLGTATSSLWTRFDGREKSKTAATPLASGTNITDWVAAPVGSRSVQLEASINVLTIGAFKVKIFMGRYEVGKVLLYNPKLNVA